MWTAQQLRGVARRAAAVGAVPVLMAAGAACNDGRPDFCDDLARSADMKGLNDAFQAQDLGRARAAADRFSELAAAAPSDIRDDFEDLANAVEDIVELLAAERSATPGAGDDGQGDAAAVEQQRDQLNRRLDELSATSSSVERWASRECGLSLR